MSLDADVLIDRRRLKRKITFWRVAAVLAFGAALVAIMLAATGRDLGGRDRPHIARLTLSGFISDDRKQLDLVDRIRRAKNVRAVIVSIDSPGGTTAGGEALYEAVRKLAAEKPTVATITGTGASAAYLVALATDRIVARRNAITGSIGVLVQWPDLSQVLTHWGIRLEEVKSAPLKAEPNPLKPASPEAKAVIQAMVEDSYQWFVGLVAERRKLAPDDARRLADGRVFTGNQALALKLVDAVGGEEAAIAWLEAERGVAKGLRIQDWKPSSGRGWGFADSLAESLAEATGLREFVRRTLVLDGLRSLWHGPTATDVAAPRGAGE